MRFLSAFILSVALCTLHCSSSNLGSQGEKFSNEICSFEAKDLKQRLKDHKDQPEKPRSGHFTSPSLSHAMRSRPSFSGYNPTASTPLFKHCRGLQTPLRVLKSM